MVNLRVCLLVGILTLAMMTGNAVGQTSRLIPWNDSSLTLTSLSITTYHPEPIILVHGTTASRARCVNVINYLHGQNWFQAYHYNLQAVLDAKESTVPPGEDYADNEVPEDERNQWRDIEQPYIHTWNYGRHAKRGPLPYLRPTIRPRVSRQSSDPLEWNSWGTNTAWGVLASDYLDGRVTLKQRIEQIRDAYRMPGQAVRPSVLLIGHSQGGLLIADYLMSKNADLQGDSYVPVRRAVTVDSLLWGSPLGNLGTNWKIGLLNPYVGLLKGALKTGAGVTSPGFSVWLQNANGAMRYFAMDLQDGVAHGDIPQMAAAYQLATAAPFAQKARSTLMPTTTEFITSVARKPNPSPPAVVAEQVVLRPTLNYPALRQALHGDGLVPLDSQAGYHADGVSAFSNICPVDIRGYLYTGDVAYATNWISSHGPAVDKLGIYPHLFDGVQYLTGPRPERPGGWSGLQKQYTSSPLQTAAGITLTHTDEPGVGQTHVLAMRAADQNPFFVPTTNTWQILNGAPQKVATNASDLVGRQIAGSSQGVMVVGTTGVKNRSQNPAGMQGTNYWVMAGNEYMPASMSFRVTSATTPLTVALTTNDLDGAARIVTNCLVQLDNTGAVQFQYGYFETNGIQVTAGTNNFVAVQGYNLAGLLTPQAERAFDVPVTSSNLVAILRRINEAESLSNACHTASEPTRWTNSVCEWLTLTTNTTVYPLNFAPVSGTPVLLDAWTGTNLTAGWSYDSASNAVVVTDFDLLSTHVIASNEVFLGTAAGFTNAGGAFVPALTNADALAGVPVNETFLSLIRTQIVAVLPKYRDTTATNCVAWTLTNLLTAAGNTTGAWLPVTNGLLTAAHFTELANVTSLLTNADACSCQRVTAFICEGRIGNAASSSNWWSGTFETDITHTNTGAPVAQGNFPWYSTVYSPIEIRYDATTRVVDFRLFTNSYDYVQLTMTVRSNVFGNVAGAMANLKLRVAAKVANSWTYLDSVQVVCSGTTNQIGALSTSYDGGTESTMTASNLALQAGFVLTGNARFDWSANPTPQNSQLSFQISADEAP